MASIHIGYAQQDERDNQNQDEFTHATIYPKPERPLKILFVVGSFPLLPETFIVNQITGLLDRGHEVFIYACHNGGQKRKVHADVIKYDLLKRTYVVQLPSDLHTYDIILCQFGPLGKKFVKIRKQLGLEAKIITCFRGYDLSREIKSKGKHAYDRLFQEGDLFLPVCEYFKDKLIKLGCDPQKIIVHHSAIDPSRFKFRTNFSKKTDTVLIYSVNRLVPKKGTEYAIRAVSRLIHKYPALRYNIVGGGYRKGFLLRLIRRLRLYNKIKLLDWATQDEVIAALKKADIFILPSVTARDGNEEGIPNALKEAMSCGIPVVSTYCAGIPELIKDGKSGFLVRQRDVINLTHKIEYLMKHSEQRVKMGIEGRKVVEKEYDVEKLNDRLLELFYSVLDQE